MQLVSVADDRLDRGDYDEDDGSDVADLAAAQSPSPDGTPSLSGFQASCLPHASLIPPSYLPQISLVSPSYRLSLISSLPRLSLSTPPSPDRQAANGR